MLNDLSIFCTVVQEKTFSAAANQLGLSPSTITKAIARLENKLATKLFYRNTRHITLTLEGQAFFEQAKSLLIEADDLFTRFSTKQQAIEGLIKIDMPVFLGRYKLLTEFNQLTKHYPKLQFELIFSDTYNNLVSNGVDITIRIGELADSSLIAKKIGEQNWLLCCTPKFYQTHCQNLSYENLTSVPSIAYKVISLGKLMPWRFRDQSIYPVNPRLIMTCGEAIKAAVLDDIGLAQLPDYFVEKELANGALLELFPECRPLPTPIYAITSYKSWSLEKIQTIFKALETTLNI